MATINTNRTTVHIDTRIVLELNEAEARALDGIFGYDVEAFLRVFYEKMGKAYVQPHEAGVRSLHESIRKVLAGPLAEVDKAKQRIRAAQSSQ